MVLSYVEPAFFELGMPPILRPRFVSIPLVKRFVGLCMEDLWPGFVIGCGLILFNLIDFSEKGLVKD